MISLKDRFPSRVLLHRGDLALSFRARDSVLERDVFIKVLNPVIAHDAEIRGRFEREAKAVARLDHPNLVRIYEYGQDADEGMYMLLEWVDGGNLSAHLKQRGKLSPEAVESLAHQLLAGLAALHSVGIVHRDLKPENILVRETSPDSSAKAEGETAFKISDFSLAMLKDAPGLTHHEAIVGTPAYMSPEQAAGGKISAQSDLFSLGVILYEAATGMNPLIGETMLDTLRKIRESDVSLEHTGVLSLPVSLRKLLEALLRKSPEYRPKSAHAAFKMIEGTHYRDLKPQKYKRDLAYLAIAVVVVGATLVMMMKGKGEKATSEKSKADSGLIASNVEPVDSIARELDTDTVTEDSVSKIVTMPDLQKDGIVLRPQVGQPLQKVPLVRIDSASSSLPPSSTQGVNEESATLTDSVELWIVTEPWAHVYVNGQREGTTPLAEPFKVRAGEASIELKNPAYPDVSFTLTLEEETVRREFHLADFVALLRTNVKPWGDLYLDGEHVGTTPLHKPLFVSAGKHEIRITHPSLPTLEKTFTVIAGDTLNLSCDLTRSEWLVNNGNGVRN